MNPIELTCNSDGTMSIGIKQGFHVYTEEENSKILGVVEHLKAENERLRGVEASNIALRATNAKLRGLVRDLRFCARQSICLKCEHGRICDLRLDERCAELRIEVDR